MVMLPARSQQRVAEAYAYLMLTVMGNYSYTHSWEGPCAKSGTIDPLHDSPQLDVYFPRNINLSDVYILFNDSAHALRFLSCGRQGISMLPFDELLNVFDMSTW